MIFENKPLKSTYNITNLPFVVWVEPRPNINVGYSGGNLKPMLKIVDKINFLVV